MRRASLLLLLIACAGRVPGQDIPVTLVHSGPETRPGSFSFQKRGEPTFELLPQSAGARAGHVWVSSSTAGLLVEGTVDGQASEWPATLPEMLAKDHVEVWLAAGQELAFPPIGWGNQFGENELKSENDCSALNSGMQVRKLDECKAWFREQVKYRVQLKKLFIRQWLLSGDAAAAYSSHTVETYAHAALQNITANFFPDVYTPASIEPARRDGVRMWVGPAAAGKSGYSFQISIPYPAFPPLPSLSINNLRLMVDVFSAAPAGKKTGAFSSTASQRKWGDPSTFARLRIEHPVELKLSPCAYPLAQQDLYGVEQPSFVYPVPRGIKPGEAVVIDRVVSLMNPAQGYLYDPAGASPSAEVRQMFSKPTGDGGFACGPKLRYVRGALSVVSKDNVDEEGLDSKVLADGWTLIKTGPRAEATTFGSGQCGACPRASLTVYSISPTGRLATALKIYEVIGNETAAADFDFSADWTHATYFHQATDGEAWTATKYCLTGHQYEACGSEQNAAPPDPPRVKGLREKE